MAAPAPSPAAYASLARALPKRLQTFFARYPPPEIMPAKGHKPPPTLYQTDRPNPFLKYKNPTTGVWHDPVYSMRRQAELVKMAREHGVESLLPEGPKGTEARIAKRVTFGLRVKGTGIGQKVKGHKHERNFEEKFDKKREAIEGMLPLVKQWRKTGAYRWQKFPK